ncbi:ABC transporter substrate-binding protein [Bordetella genomosp. 8]|uniref:ABC transporter substrate-binding protein n=1 Tax=Bordetella genomosp. 8 TaxID=1416806 RepID=A0A1W6YHW1_9BORD|nr:tripartite tricarboxylate transporter substrate binding protein [Bordetella genomosp. 8]ARP80686.1 ABC transporter substrate-binding protein [Bordetella genomosp. 8]
MTIIDKLCATLALGVAAALAAGHACAADYPVRATTIYVGFAAGGPTDVVARLLAEGLSRKLGQPFVVENRPGASGELAANLVKKAAPDGYTLMVGANGTLAILPVVKKGLGYEPLHDFTPIAPVARFPYYLVVSNQSRFRSYGDLIETGRKPAENLTFGSAGPGSANHLAGVWFSKAAGIASTHVPYKGDAAVLSDLIAGRVDFAFLAGSIVIPQVDSKNLRMLASASSSADIGLPGLPILGQGPLAGYSAEPWNGLLGPAGMPESVVRTLNAAVNEVMTSDSVAARLKAIDQYPFPGSAQAFADHIRTQTERTAEIVRKSNLTIE